MEQHDSYNATLPYSTDEVDEQDMLDNIRTRLHGPMKEFFTKYFGDFAPTYQVDPLSNLARLSDPSCFLQRFKSSIAHIQQQNSVRGHWHIIPCHDRSSNGDASVILTIPPGPLDDASEDGITWSHVQVIGQVCSQNTTSYQDGLVRLCQGANSIFFAQPTRRFTHGFYVRHSAVEFWVIDRSGLYCSPLLDLTIDWPKFLSAMCHYQHMTDSQLGRCSLVQTDDAGTYVVLPSSLKKLYIEEKPLALRQGIVGHGMSCFRARLSDSSSDWDSVLKFKWRWVQAEPEDKLLRLAKDRNAWGAIWVDYYDEVESTSDLRAGMRWGPHKELIPATMGVNHGLSAHSVETDDYFQSRALSMTVTSPLGRPLDTFRNIAELLEVFRDAIKCHRSLLVDAKILHQDISPGNIIILDDQDKSRPRGILIDLDSAILVDKEFEPERGITGTRPFMAIGVLRSEPHTYRHDLESFFYAFLWSIITNHRDSPPETSRLRQWSNADWSELADRKASDVMPDRFQAILHEFPPEFHPLRPLAEQLRQLLFPNGEDGIVTDNRHFDGAAERLYDKIIAALDGAA
ncbi:unnamed protein product [Clonostachys rosea]|uniref:Fungal-type protein kinase domain-containing protein n=1 Tax=Bionectria ochroleuca TaxID=29856 RepID=A0ABY6U9Q6_BIOOC|nr:unnamed protein product [Clonostachys rosea]